MSRLTSIVAYGSLLNRDSVRSTILRDPEMEVFTLEGFRRIFNANPGTKYSYLNLQPAVYEPNEVQVASIEVTNAELNVIRARESGYDLREVARGQYAFIWRAGGFANYPPTLLSYINVCEEGATQLGIRFWKGTIEPEVVQDSANPQYSKYWRPWNRQGSKALRRLAIRRFLRMK